MKVELLYFAWIREQIGRDGEAIDPPASVVSIGDLVDWLIERGEPYAQAFENRNRLRAAIDQRFANLDDPIAGAREIALFPPVTGG